MYRLPPGARNRLHLGARSSKLPFVGDGGILLYHQGHRPRPQLLTFDDGYADHLFDALPLLERYDIPAAVFIMTGVVDGDRETWRDRLEQAVFATPEWPSARELKVEGNAVFWTRSAGLSTRRRATPSIRASGNSSARSRGCGRATVRPARPSCARSCTPLDHHRGAYPYPPQLARPNASARSSPRARRRRQAV